MTERKPPLVVSIEMGYGHLRAATSLASALGVELLQADRPPLADAVEQTSWESTRVVHETLSRRAALPGTSSRPLAGLLNQITAIPPLYPSRDQSAPTLACRLLDVLAGRRGLGRGLVTRMRESGSPLLTTYFAPALLADREDCGEVYCVVTDADINRIWVPTRPEASRIVYLAPCRRVERRLWAYGVAPARVRVTGFPLPDELLGGRDLSTARRHLAERLVRLDPSGAFRARSESELTAVLGELPSGPSSEPPLVTFAVGGTGAQADLADPILKSLAPALRSGELRLALIAGVRDDVAKRFERFADEAGVGDLWDGPLELLHRATLADYFTEMNRLLARTDVLWTKPGELVFYGALGLPLLLSEPVGVNERYNRRWVVERGAAMTQRDPSAAVEHLRELLDDGVLAAMAWAGFRQLPNLGLYNIVDELS